MHFGSFFYLISTAHSASLPGLSPGAHLHDTYVRGEAYSYRLKNFVGENVFSVFTYYFFLIFLINFKENGKMARLIAGDLYLVIISDLNLSNLVHLFFLLKI